MKYKYSRNRLANRVSQEILVRKVSGYGSTTLLEYLKERLLAKAPTKQGKNNGLVCPDCLVEHCRHCKCEKCCKQGKKVNPPQNRIVYSHNDLDNAVRIDNQWAEDLQDSKPKKVKEIRGLTKTLVAVAPGTEYLEVTSIGDIRVKTVKGIKHGAGYSQVIVDEVSIGDITTLIKNK